MKKSEIEKDMKQFLGGACWINRKQVAEYLGCYRKSDPVAKAIAGCPKFGSKYAVVDVAERIYEQLNKKLA